MRAEKFGNFHILNLPAFRASVDQNDLLFLGPWGIK